MTPRFFKSFILVNIFIIPTNLYEPFIRFFRKTSVITAATLDQIAAFALTGAPLPRAKDRKIADDKRKAIKKVIDKFKSGDWSLKGPQEEESSTEEYDDDSEDPDN